MNTIENEFRKKLLLTDEFLVTFELVPGRSARGRNVQKLLAFAEEAASDGRLDALTLTDNPGGNPSVGPDELGQTIQGLGIDAIVHMACRDSNRFGLYSRAQQLDHMGLRNLLVLTGDYPTESLSGVAKPCFDLDSVTLLCLLKEMNMGDSPFCMTKAGKNSQRTDFFTGAAVSGGKASEAEQMTQYYKLVRKVRNGAQFAITQLGYDARKFDELLRFARMANITIPFLGTVYILTEPAARFMNQGKVPGAYVSDKLYSAVAEEAKAADKGKAASLERAARLMAILYGIGYRGVHLSGKPDNNDVRTILDSFEAIRDDWRSFVSEFSFPYKDGFYLFEEDSDTGLNSSTEISRSGHSVKHRCIYRFYAPFHDSMFKCGTRIFKMSKAVADYAATHPWFRGLYTELEHVAKRLMFGCRKCGDCALAEMAYVCPESKCPKSLRNGPCGGSDKTNCEVFPDKPCAWIAVFNRLKAVGRESELQYGCAPPRDWSLDQTASWLNFYAGIDHHKVCTKCEHQGPDKTRC
ncbi:MAG: methylenetetrahydrofolate reductase C-terminal domain-containing protein [Kiritimatiellia bacterium]|jgi:methylenetetrahydrofolate reductase (NADPH)|nr:methylenetetrahydrofolate reductase C-terminal domain-containing protein [Kiritimatiellia bacterium]